MKSIFRLLSLVIIGMFTLTVFAVDGELEQEPKEEIQKIMDVDVSNSAEMVLEITSTSTDAKVHFRESQVFLKSEKTEINLAFNGKDFNKRYRCSLEKLKSIKRAPISYPIHIDPGWLFS